MVRPSALRTVAAALALAALMALPGCSHRLVAPKGRHSVEVYPDEATFQKVRGMKAQGGAVGMLGDMGESLVAKKVAADATVNIISSDANGSQIEVTSGPNSGLKGFVAKDNVN